MTKEEKREYDKANYQANKERKKALYQANKEEIKLKRRIKYLSRKEKEKSYSKAYRESRKDGMYTLYYLPEEHYIGITTNMYNRLKRHKSQGNHTTDVEVVAKFDNKKEALSTERYMHNIGYNGINKHTQR